MKNPKGISLMEGLVVIVILFILGAIIYVAVDPVSRFGDARNAQRRSDVVAILNALLKYQIDNNGAMPASFDAATATSQVLGTDASACDASCPAAPATASCLDLSSVLVPNYLQNLPLDPQSGKPSNTGYYVNRTASGRILVGACHAENGAPISVAR